MIPWRLAAVGLVGCGRLNYDALEMTDAAEPADAIEDTRADADPLQAGLLVHLKMDDDPADGTLDDASGAGRVARCVVGASCPIASAGRIGNAVRFFGARCARITFEPALLTAASYTVAAWLYVDVDTDQVPFAKPYGSGDLDGWGLVAWGSGSTLGTGTCMESLNPAGTGHENACGPQISFGRWLHIAMRWTGQAKALFMDGVKVGELAPATTSAIDDHDIVVGCDENMGTPAFYYQGLLDELRIYDRALSDTELGALANP